MEEARNTAERWRIVEENHVNGWDESRRRSSSSLLPSSPSSERKTTIANLASDDFSGQSSTFSDDSFAERPIKKFENGLCSSYHLTDVLLEGLISALRCHDCFTPDKKVYCLCPSGLLTHTHTQTYKHIHTKAHTHMYVWMT